MWICFAPVAYDTAQYFDVSVFLVNMLSVIFLVMFIPFSFVGIYVCEAYGLRSLVSNITLLKNRLRLFLGLFPLLPLALTNFLKPICVSIWISNWFNKLLNSNELFEKILSNVTPCIAIRIVIYSDEMKCRSKKRASFSSENNFEQYCCIWSILTV